MAAEATAPMPVSTNTPIIVTASRANRTTTEMPANVTVITADTLRDSGAGNVVTALETLSGVYFRHNADNPGQAEISMRGFGENSFGRVLVLVDGQRLNNADMSNPDWLRIPVSAIDRIEVLHGGQTILYGDNAEAGVINIITRQPTDKPVTTLSATVGSDNTLAGHIGHSGAISGDTRYTSDLDWSRSNGTRDNSGFNDTDARGTLTHDWTEHFATTLAAFYTDDYSEMPGPLYLAQLRQNPDHSNTPYDNVTATTFGGSLGANGQLDADSHVEGQFSASHRDVRSEYYSLPSFSVSTLDTYTFSPRYINTDDIAGHRNSLLAGVDLGLNVLDIRSYTNVTRTIQTTDATLERANAGLYAQDEFWLTDQLAFTLGGRGEIYRYHSDVTDVFGGTSETYERVYRQSALDAALLYKPVESLRLFARAASIYHDPFLDELTGAYGFISSFGATPPSGMNLDLKPEVGHQYDLGANAELSKNWSAAASLYCLDLQDEIAYDPATFANSNIPHTRRYGTDTSLTWQQQGVGMASLDYNYVDAFQDYGAVSGKQIPLVPAQTITLHGEIDLPLDLAALGTVRGVSAQYMGDDYTHESPRLPTYGTLDLGLRYRPHALDGFELLIGVDNVLDKGYANSGYDYGAPFAPWDVYYPAPGRTWKVTASYRF